MYERFFGLRERPFELPPNPRFLYLARRHREALTNLQYGLGAARGLILLVGDAGTGKTTLIESALAGADRDRVECVVLSNPTLTRAEFYEFLAIGFGLSPEAAASKTRFLIELRRYLEQRYVAGCLSALVIDEAQSLPCELLEEVRLLSNIETSTVKLMNVVLAGQPELAERLNDPRLRQLKQRISLRCALQPLDFIETASYVAGRLRIAGGQPAQIFTREAIQAVHAMSGGIPRTVNVICDNALIGGFAAQAKPVPRALVEEVCADFDLRHAGSEQRAAGFSSVGVVGTDSGEETPSTSDPSAEVTDEPAVVEAASGTTGRKKGLSFF